MRRYIDVVQSLVGDAIPNATVSVTNQANGQPAALFTGLDGATPLANPVTTDARGVFSFYAEDGIYTLAVTTPTGETATVVDVELGSAISGRIIDPTAYPFNADRTGATPAGQALQDALEEMQSSGRRLVIPDGRYWIDPLATPYGGLYVTGDRIDILGEGAVDLLTGADGQSVFTAEGQFGQYQKFKLQGLRFYSQDGHPLFGTTRNRGCTGLRLEKTVGATVADVETFNFHTGVYLNATQHCTFDTIKPMWGVGDSYAAISRDSVGLHINQDPTHGGGNNNSFNFLNVSVNDIGVMMTANSPFPLHSNGFTNPVIMACRVCGIYIENGQLMRFTDATPENVASWDTPVYSDGILGVGQTALDRSRQFTVAPGQSITVRGKQVKRAVLHAKDHSSVHLENFFLVSSESTQQMVLENDTTVYADGFFDNYQTFEVDASSAFVPRGQLAVFDSANQKPMPSMGTFEDTGYHGRTMVLAHPFGDSGYCAKNHAAVDPKAPRFTHFQWAGAAYPDAWAGAEHVPGYGMMAFTQFPPALGDLSNKRTGFDLVPAGAPGLTPGGLIAEATPYFLAATFMADRDAYIGVDLCQSTGGGGLHLKAGEPMRALFKGTPPLSQPVSGRFAVYAPAGVASITINGTTITEAQLAASATSPISVATTHGTLKVVGSSGNEVVYQYSVPAQTITTDVLDSIPVSVLDDLGGVAAGSLDVLISNTPPAGSGTTTFIGVVEDAVTTRSGNLIPPGVTTTIATVTGVAAGVVGGSTAGQYGSLLVLSNGFYSYTLNNAAAEVQALAAGDTLRDIFTYTRQGDATTYTLNVAIAGIGEAAPAITAPDLAPGQSGVITLVRAGPRAPIAQIYPLDTAGARLYVFDIVARAGYDKTEIIAQSLHGAVNPKQDMHLVQSMQVRGDESVTVNRQSAPTQVFNAPLTANRNVELSVEFFDSGVARRYRIVRTAAATGQFFLSVGQNALEPIAYLGPGEWCEVTNAINIFGGPTVPWFVCARGRTDYPITEPGFAVPIAPNNLSPDVTVDVHGPVEQVYYGGMDRDATVTMTGQEYNSRGFGRRVKVIRNQNTGNTFKVFVKQGAATLATLTEANQWVELMSYPGGWFVSGYGRMDEAPTLLPRLVVAGDADTAISGVPQAAVLYSAPITALRNVTLNTLVGSGARLSEAVGKLFRVVRAASATGAFDLNVRLENTAILKTLAPGQWCDVMTDGTTWHLAGFGSL